MEGGGGSVGRVLALKSMYRNGVVWMMERRRGSEVIRSGRIQMALCLTRERR